MQRIIFALAAVVLGSGCICSGCACPSSYGYNSWLDYRNAEIADRQRRAQPVIDALAAFKAAHGEYPRALDELVAEHLLDAVPDLATDADHQGKAGRVEKAGPLRYEPGAADYRLRVTFSFREQAWASVKDYRLEYRPGGPGWGVNPYPETPPAPAAGKS